MIISRTEIANAATAFKAWEPNVIPFPSRRGRILKPDAIAWARSAYDSLPHLRCTLVIDLRGRIIAGRYFVPADLIVDSGTCSVCIVMEPSYIKGQRARARSKRVVRGLPGGPGARTAVS